MLIRILTGELGQHALVAVCHRLAKERQCLDGYGPQHGPEQSGYDDESLSLSINQLHLRDRDLLHAVVEIALVREEGLRRPVSKNGVCQQNDLHGAPDARQVKS